MGATFDTVSPETGRPLKYRYAFDPILVQLGMKVDEDSVDRLALSDIFGINPGAIAIAIESGLTVWTADRYATLLGVGPADLWPEWWDHAEHDMAGLECKGLLSRKLGPRAGGHWPTLEPVLTGRPVCDICGGRSQWIDLHAWLIDGGPIAWSA